MSFFAASVAMRNLRAQANRDALSGGKLRLYVGTVPADLGAITNQLLVAEYVLPSPSGAVAAGTLTLGPVEQVIALGSGPPNFFRLLSSANVALFDGSAGAVGSGAVAQISPYPVIAGGLLYVDFARLIEP